MLNNYLHLFQLELYDSVVKPSDDKRAVAAVVAHWQWWSQKVLQLFELDICDKGVCLF